MISEILEFISTLTSLPNRETKPNESRKEFIVFLSYLIAIVSLIFIVPEFKIIMKDESSKVFIISNIFTSFILSLIVISLLKKMKILDDLIFSTFITLLIAMFLLFFLITLLLINNYF
jgi:quinol-cytochrome oxidoreductase complex cytochrome b subunit